MNAVNIEKIVSRKRQVSLLMIGVTLIVWGVFLLSFVFIYKGVF
jgi:hypothetical protein